MSLALDLRHEPLTGIPHGKLVMWAFLASEIMFFSGFFGAFIVLRNANIDIFMKTALGDASNPHIYPGLNWKLALLNTFFLIASSLTMALSILNLERKNKSNFQMYLFITILCACGFLVVKYFEYSAKFGHHIFPNTNIFYAFYFLMTGFHAMHVIGGMIPMVWMFSRSFTQKGYTNPVRLEVLGLYWHFVDLVWIFLFPALYLLYPGGAH